MRKLALVLYQVRACGTTLEAGTVKRYDKAISKSSTRSKIGTVHNRDTFRQPDFLMPRTSKAATIVQPGQIEVREYDVPSLPKGGLLMKVEMSGICGTDKHTYRGETTQYGGTVNEQISPFPLILGHENVGFVVEVSPGKTDFYGRRLREGDRITMCPDGVCGRCYNCQYIFGYSWCEEWRGYGNSFRADQQPLMGG